MSSVKGWHKRIVTALAACMVIALAGCGTGTPSSCAETAGDPVQTAPGTGGETVTEAPPADPGTRPGETVNPDHSEGTPVTKTMKIYIDKKELPVTWQDNDSVEALKELAANGLAVRMSMYGGFEQVGPLGANLPRDDKQTTAVYGDVVLYSGNQIVIFYGSNSWSYTRLGHIDLSKAEMTDLLSNGDVTVTLKYE